MDAGTVRAVATVCVVSLLIAGGWWWTGRSTPADSIPRRSGTVATPTAAAASTATPAAPGAAGPQPASGTPGAPGTAAVPVAESGALVVDVRGAVRRPGVRELPAGSRVLDAVRAAGGLRAGRGYGAVNLARLLVDGEQVIVGRRAGSGPAPAGSGPGSGSDPAAVIDLNSATAEQLEELDGVGEVLAGRIVAWREANGRFTAVEDLIDVEGIGEATLSGLRDSVRVG